MKGTLVVRRDADDDIKMRNLEVHLDGKWVADLEYGRSFETELDPGEHEVMVTNKLKAARMGFALREGETAVFEGVNVLSKGVSAVLAGLGMVMYHAKLRRVQ